VEAIGKQRGAGNLCHSDRLTQSGLHRCGRLAKMRKNWGGKNFEGRPVDSTGLLEGERRKVTGQKFKKKKKDVWGSA